MVSNTATVITKRSHVLFILSVLLLLAAVFPASGQSMIPDDFDWSYYIQDDDWYSWGETPQQNYYQETNSYEQPFTYDWYGQTYQLDTQETTENSWGNDPNWWQTGSYQDTTSQQNSGWYGTGQTQNNYDSDGWFYQTVDDYFDDFDSWTGTVEVPSYAYVSGFVGYAQSYNLDCEARSAIDLAAYFGVNIGHADFLSRLPRSDDPNVGFVGNYTDARGKIPPSSYGVYQEPVAALLRQYGLNAYGAYGYSENALKAQIAAGRPVMAWVVGNTELGYAVPYTPASTGMTTYVVPYQHTVVVIGYDANNVTIQDGGMKYTRDWKTFLLSWGVLGNRAIYVN